MSQPDAEAEVDRLVARVKVAKAEAKDLRDDGDVPGAIRVLESAVALLDRSWLKAEVKAATPASDAEKRMAAQLADCLGMLGGNYRRDDQPGKAQAVFLRGREYEQAPRLQVESSYNLVNAITLPLEATAATTADLTADLRGAIDAIDRQVNGNRRKDRWAWADLAQCRLLLGDSAEAMRNYARARDLGDDDTVRSITGVLERQQAALTKKDPAAAARLAEAIAVLR